MELLGRSVRAAVGGARPPVVDELARQSQSTIKITTLSQPGTNLYTVTNLLIIRDRVINRIRVRVYTYIHILQILF